MKPQTAEHPGLIEPFAQAQHGLPLLGHLVWWSVPRATEIALPDLEQKLADAGLAKNLVPTIQARSALTIALQRLETKDLIRRVTEDTTKIVYALVAENVDAEAMAIDFSQVQTVIFRKEKKELAFKNGAHVEVIRELFEKYRVTITAPRLRSLIRRVLEKADPVVVRDAMLFIPKKHAGLLDTAIAFIDSIGQGPSLSRLGLVDSSETRATMLKVVRQELDQEIETAKKELAELVAKETVRASTYARRLKSYKALRAKVEGYAELLTFSAQGLLEKLEMLDKKVQNVV